MNDDADRTAGSGRSELRGRAMGATRREGAVRSLYEQAPYPDLGAGLKDPGPVLAPIRAELVARGAVEYLEVGCGTGHLLVGVATAFPAWRCHGIDLSAAALAVARELAQMHGAKVELHQGSYLSDLPFAPGSFDVISAQGTIHHCDDPAAALANLRRYLKDDGFLSMHLYGLRLDREKFDLKEAISIFEPDLFAHESRFAVYRALVEHRRRLARFKRWLDISPLDVLRWLRKAGQKLRRRSRDFVRSPPWGADYSTPTSPWRDHFCHPCERAYEVPELRRLVEDSGFRVAHMRGQGRVNLRLVPPELHERFARLDPWDQWRLMELLAPAQSFAVILTKAHRPM